MLEMRKKNGAARMIYIFVSRWFVGWTRPRNYVKHNAIPAIGGNDVAKGVHEKSGSLREHTNAVFTLELCAVLFFVNRG
jgi:hypothetical protein